jgi:hydroxyacylglutathione hydrolase
MLHLQRFTFNPFSENTYILADNEGTCAIIDPGCYDDQEQRELKDYIHQKGLQPVMLLNTHCHIDHVLGNHFVYKTWGLQPHIHPDDEADLARLIDYAPVFGIQAEASPAPAGYLEHGKELQLGNLRLEMRLTPGHSAGSICFIHHNSATIIAGDVLFAGSIGRTDLPGGNFSTLINNIKSQLFTLPDHYVVYPGHGPETTIGHEKATNPFF